MNTQFHGTISRKNVFFSFYRLCRRQRQKRKETNIEQMIRRENWDFYYFGCASYSLGATCSKSENTEQEILNAQRSNEKHRKEHVNLPHKKLLDYSRPKRVFLRIASVHLFLNRDLSPVHAVYAAFSHYFATFFKCRTDLNRAFLNSHFIF